MASSGCPGARSLRDNTTSRSRPQLSGQYGPSDYSAAGDGEHQRVVQLAALQLLCKAMGGIFPITKHKRLPAEGRSALALLCQGQAHNELTSLPLPLTECFDGAPVRLH